MNFECWAVGRFMHKFEKRRCLVMSMSVGNFRALDVVGVLGLGGRW